MQEQSSHRGQSLVELALVLPILILLLLIVADGARVFSAHLALGNAVREGASYGARSNDSATDHGGIVDAVYEESGQIFGRYPSVHTSVVEDEYGYDSSRVTVYYQFEMLFSFPGLPDTISLERSAQMRILEV